MPRPGWQIWPAADCWLACRTYGDGLTCLVRVGPVGEAPGTSELVKVHFREVVTRGESAVLALRWEATGADGGFFPVLDADVSLVPAGGLSTRLLLAGVYRPPPAALGASPGKAVFDGMADATVRSLLAASRTLSPVPRSRPAPSRKPT